MQIHKVPYLIGLIDPKVLKAIEDDSLNPVFLDLQACNGLEIRYDFFDVQDWPSLSARVRKIAPHAMQIGTIRLKRDGGTFADNLTNARLSLWNEILKASDVPEWLDLEQDCLYDYQSLKNLADIRGTKLLISQHNFLRIPNQQELNAFAMDAKRLNAPGLKIAAMSNSETDCDRLYQFAKENAQDFELFAAFGMGETGKVSRLWSLKEGSNLTYGAIGKAAAPGQLGIPAMKSALDTFQNINSVFELSSFLAKF